MRVLAVHTASPRLSLALIEGDAGGGAAARVIFAEDIDDPRDQGNFMLQSITQGLAANKLAFADIDLMAAVTGPGSFTGIRMGLAALRGFALASDVPLTGVTSFTLYAATCPVTTPHRLTVMESWREELYFQLDDAAPFNVTPRDCLDMLTAQKISGSDVTLLGDAQDKMLALLPGAITVTALPTATDLARLVMTRPDMGEDALPFYLRPPDVTLPPGGRQLQKFSDGA